MTHPAQKVLDALGITTRHILAADIRLRPNEMPTITLECVLDHDAFVTRRFILLPDDDPAPYDLDRQCREAMARLRAGIEESVKLAWDGWRMAAAYRAYGYE